MKFRFAPILILFSFFVLTACENESDVCPPGEEHCACFDNGSCLHGMYCGPAGRCEYPDKPDAGTDTGNDISNPDVTVECNSDSDCDAKTDTQGYLCNNNECVVCISINDCTLSDYYGGFSDCSEEGRCVVVESCQNTGCEEGKVCDEMSGRCRMPYTCEDIQCMPGQICQETVNSEDAYCLNECVEGMIWNQVEEVCETILPNCREEWDNSILEDCLVLQRECVELEGGGAECGDCLNGYKEEAGSCVAVTHCSDLSCEAENRRCVEAADHEDAHCDICLGGFIENFGECVQNEGANCLEGDSDSILVQCASEQRECVASANGAACGDCIAGTVESPYTGNCVPVRTCSELNCEARHRVCTDTWNAECGACENLYEEDPFTGECKCINGYLPDETGACVPIRTCADIGAACSAVGELCIEANEGFHAYCRKCPEDEAWYEHWETCLPCPPCRKTGETGRVYPITTRMGHCVCETKPGYFHSESGSGGTFACDNDGDGWIVEDARLPMESAEDSAEKENARCDLRYIDRIILKNEQGVEKEIMLSDFDFLYEPVPLYEPANRDKSTKMENDKDYTNPLMANYVTALGGGRYLNPEELNPMTKACPTNPDDPYAKYADFNANGVYDIEEAGYKDSNPNPEKRIFAMFSYYIELYRGWYEKPENAIYGRYIIQEKARNIFASPVNKVAFTYPGPSDYWRKCRRRRDSEYSEDGPSFGFDFANYGADSSCSFANEDDVWCGMNHHSQFKCMQIISSSNYSASYPQKTTATKFSNGYEANVCSLTGNEVEPVTSGNDNPSQPLFSCYGENSNSMETGMIFWGLAKYESYGDEDSDNESYVRGCINECTEQASLPPDEQCIQGGIDDKPVLCKGQTINFGKLFCYREIDFVNVPMSGASFLMGSPELPEPENGRSDNEELHQVNFKYIQDLEVTSTEVTQDQFMEFMGYNPSRFTCDSAICPVEQVSWYDALAFANKLSLSLGYTPCYKIFQAFCYDGTWEEYDENDLNPPYCKDHGGIARVDYISLKDSIGIVSETWQCEGYRLPTEAEWEFLARAGTQTAYYSGDSTALNCEDDATVSSIAWYCANSDQESGPSPVATLSPNAFGLYDMLGNVLEWTSDGDYNEITINTDINPEGWGAQGNSVFTSEIINRVVKGGAWNRSAQDARAAKRNIYAPITKVSNLGFRVVRSVFKPRDKYLFVKKYKSWGSAKEYCENLGYKLASVNSEGEDYIISRIVGAWETFIGSSDIFLEGRWEWEDGSGFWQEGGVSTMYTNWISGEPNNTGGAEDCMTFKYGDNIRGRHWNDLTCIWSRYFLCEEVE